MISLSPEIEAALLGFDTASENSPQTAFDF